MSSDKPLPASHKKLQEARKRGEIAKSQELTQLASLLALLAYGWTAAQQALDSLVRVFALLDELRPALLSPDGLLWFITQAFARCAGLLVVVLLLPLVSGLFAGLMQNGWLFSMQPMLPKFERLNPAQNAKNMFSLHKLADVVRRLAKAACIAAALWWLGRRVLASSLAATERPAGALLGLVSGALLQLISIGAGVFVLGAALDYVLQRAQFLQGQRMTHDEARRERKDSDGDPHVRSRRKSLHREMAMSRMVENAKRARVLVTNPTHVAVALRYGGADTDVPVLVAKGVDDLARRMKDAAREAGVPIYEDVPLARKLFAAVELDAAIGPALFAPVADVLVWVEQLRAAGEPTADAQAQPQA